MRLSICVVLYESVATTRRFHAALMRSLEEFDEVEVLYYDNSPSGTLEDWFAGQPGGRWRYWHDQRNIGFSYANNQLILRARHERILLLNPDVFGFDASFWRRIEAMPAAEQATFVRLLNEDGSFQDCVGSAPSLHRWMTPRPDYAAMTEPAEVGVGIMAFMLATRSVFARVGLLDVDYRLYAEDLDWCHRAQRAGIPVVFDPRLELTHLGGASAGDRWSRAQSLRRKYVAEQVFIDKHFRGLGWLAMHAQNRLKLLLRAR